jgi:hypothetical protein
VAEFRAQTVSEAATTRIRDDHMLATRAAITSSHRPGGLKQQEFAVSEFRRLEVQDQGASRLGSFTDCKGRIGPGLQGDF